MTDQISDYYLERLGSHEANVATEYLKCGSSTLGRVSSNDIVISSDYVSRKHCAITVEGNEVTVKIESALNGIYVNGKQEEVGSKILLRTNDIIGIGCDTTNDEIINEKCFVFQLKKKLSEEIITLSDSEEEEDKVQELYSQLNLTEMKQEMMELEDFVEEYSRIVESECDDSKANIRDISIECANVEKVDADYIFQDIIANPDISYAEKSKLINEMVPDVASFLQKDSSTVDCKEASPPKIHDNVQSNSRTISLSNFEDEIGKSIQEPEKVKIKTRRLTVSLPCVNLTSTSVEKKLQDDNKRDETVRTTIPLTDENLAKNAEQSVEAANKHSNETGDKIVNRRHSCFIPSVNKTSLKRKVEIIEAPFMLKRRKSTSLDMIPDRNKRQPKKIEADSKWLSKKPKYQKKSKEEKYEMKSKLAALANDTKEKVTEVKTVRPNTKMPVKNTHKTRSDFLTDTIVKATPSTSRKKIDSSKNSKSVKITETIRIMDRNINDTKITDTKMTDTKITDTKSDRVPLHNSTRPSKLSFRDATHSPKISHQEPIQSSNISKRVSDNVSPKTDANSNFDMNGNSSTKSTTETTNVKSILKKPNQIIKRRRSTVTFADADNIKIFSDTPNEVREKTDSVTAEEHNSDDVIHNIMSLGVTTLKQSSNAPPINGKNFNYQTVAHQYDSLRHLQNVFIPLMKAELWKEIEDGFSQAQKQPSIYVQLNFCILDEDHKNRFKYRCQTPSLAAVQIGALILVSNVSSGQDFLGYITTRQITNQICYFDFVTSVPIHHSDEFTRTILTMKQIMYIRPNLKVFEALFKLKNSPLLQHILHPAHNCGEPKLQSFEYMGFNELNKEQMATLNKVYLKFVTTQPYVTLIEGPPGTGKSRLITNLIVQLLYGNELLHPPKVLVCAPSNAAIDIITKNLLHVRRSYSIKNKNRKKMKVVRFGVLEKMDRAVRCTSIQELIKLNEEKVLIEKGKLLNCMSKKQAELDCLSAKTRQTKEHKLKIDSLRKEISTIEMNMNKVKYDESCLLEKADIICTTLNSCCTLSNKISSMDICIIDEATQCNEPTSLIPLQFGVKSLILVGDTKQLASTVVSEIAKQYNYDQSLFQRLQKSFEAQGKNPVSQLSMQYRMHPDIAHWPNDFFYKNRLVSAESTKIQPFNLKPYTVFDLNFEQSTLTGPKHISNVDEANFVRHLLDFLIKKADPKVYSYGIISAYAQQKDDLAKKLALTFPFVSVNTIDSCQGQERDIIIISIARSRGVGFLAIRQRLNVALTRAKKMLILCGNFNSLQSHFMWNKLLDDAKKRNVYLSLTKLDDSLFQKAIEFLGS